MWRLPTVLIRCCRISARALGTTATASNPVPHTTKKAYPATSTLWRWGTTLDSQFLGAAAAQPLKMPQIIEGFQDVPIKDISCGKNHSAFVVDGELYTFGSNKHQQLGRPTANNDDEVLLPKKVAFSETIRIQSISCGAFHTMAISEEGYLYAFGWGGSFLLGVGGLGSGSKESIQEPLLIRKFVDLNEPVARVACGKQHTLVLTESGKVFSCGKGEFGRLGRGKGGDQPFFEEIEYFKMTKTESKLMDITCGASHSAVVGDNGDVWVWGRNDYGQLGLEDSMGDLYSHETYPRPLLALKNSGAKVVEIASGENHMVALTEQGSVYFWGGRAWLAPKLINTHFNDSEGKEACHFQTVQGGGEAYFYNMAITNTGLLYTWGKPRSLCLAREVNKDANEPCAVDASAFNNENVVDVACGHYRVLGITTKT